MDKLDEEFIIFRTRFKLGQWYNLKDLTDKDKDSIINRLYIWKKRMYIDVGVINSFSNILKQDSEIVSFKLLDNNTIYKKYKNSYKIAPDFIYPNYFQQLKLDL